MRSIISLSIISLSGINAHAVPLMLSHQGRLLDSSDQPLAGTQAVTFTLWDADTGTNTLWMDTVDVPFDNGYFSVSLGGGSNPIDETVLNQSEVWMSLTIGGEELLPRQRAVSAPYAVVAGTAENAFTVGGQTVGDIEDGTIATLGSTAVNLAAGTTVGGQAVATGPTLGGLSCNIGDVPVYNESAWVCVAGSSFDTVLDDTQVDAYVTNGALNLAAGTTLDSQAISTGAHTPAITSVDGLDGGTITSDVTLSGGLDVSGALQVGDGAAISCDAGARTSLRFDPINGLQVCDGSFWVAAKPRPVFWQGGCGADSPASTDGWFYFCTSRTEHNTADDYLTIDSTNSANSTSSTTGRITAKIPGYYKLSWNISGHTQIYKYIRVLMNDIELRRINYQNNYSYQWRTVGGDTVVWMDIGDYLNLHVYANVTTNGINWAGAEQSTINGVAYGRYSWVRVEYLGNDW